jgi:2-C-methyl-D-erythritol 2,4-cyclodiphosphate synthase
MISLKMLARVCDMIRSQGFVIENIDSTIFAETPKIAPYKEEMKKNISHAVEIDTKRINIKATTTEGLGMFGKGEGIGAMAVALIKT